MIIFLYGADSFRAHRFLQEMKTKFVKEVDASSHSLSVIDGSTCDLQIINQQINTGSLFVRKRLVIVENIFKNKKTKIFTDLLHYLPPIAQADNLIVIFKEGDLNNKKNVLKAEAKKLFTWLNKQKFAQEFKPLSASGLLKFIQEEAALYQKTIETTAANELIKRTGNDLWTISKEIRKTAFMVKEEKISLADIKLTVNETFNENIFALTDAISTKNQALILKILEEQYAAGLSDEYILAMLIRQFKLLLQVKDYSLSNSFVNLAADLKIHPFVAKKTWAQIKNFTAEKLLLYFNSLINLDKKNKTGQGNIKTELTLLLTKI